MQGINSFYPEDLIGQDHTTDAALLLLGIQHFNVREDNLLDKLEDFRNEKTVYLQADESFVEIEFTLLDYANFNTPTYAYQIEGEGKQWYDLKNNRLKIRRMPYGNYVIKIKGKLSDGYFSSSELSIPLSVLRPFYLRWWFIFGGIMALLALINQIFQFRNQRIIDRQKELKALVNTQTKQLREDKETIEKQTQKLIELDQQKSKFFANVAHELRTPITLIQGPVQSVLDHSNLDKRSQFLLNTTQRNTRQLLALVNQIFDLTRLESKRLELNKSDILLHSFLSKIIYDFQILAASKQIKMEFNYQTNFDLGICIDGEKLATVLQNLLSNALKFTPKDGSIKLKVEESKDKLFFQVQDTGRGIPERDLNYVFDRYYQSAVYDKAEGGLGIGLALCKELVQLMGGTIEVESKANRGSSFGVQLPKESTKILLANITHHTPILVKIEEVLQTETQATHTILVVEDNTDLSKYIQLLLADRYNCVIAENGQIALDWLKNEANKMPSLILSDVMMPEMDGFELLTALKVNTNWRNIPCIMLTARTQLDDKLKALRIGVDDYLLKPFVEKELIVRIENLIRNYEERQEYVAAQSPTISSEATIIVTEADAQWLERLEVFVKNNLTHHAFSVDYTAQQLQINRNTLFTKTKSLTGLTPNQYIRLLRLQLAKQLLETGECKSVKTAAQAVGFQKSHYFSSLFKKQFGESPSKYLNQT